MEQMKYIAAWSGGKDSTASIILAHLNGEPIDVIIFSEVMFDRENNVSGENPLHMEFVREVAKPLFEKWGYQVEILHAERDYLDCFYRVIKHPRKQMDHAGKPYGFCISKLCSVKRDCKMKPINDFLKSIKEPFKQYIGIACDEPMRLRSLSSGCISLLQKYGYTTQMALELCKEFDLLSPVYQLENKQFKRQGCWMCPNAKLEEHLYIKKNMPDAWNTYVELENVDVAFKKWNTYVEETLKERDIRLNELC